MTILVTGGAGFIGSHVVNAYIDEGHKVVVLDDLSTGAKRNINPRAIFVQGDIRDQRLLDRLFEYHAIDAVNHHAAQMDVRRSVREPIFDADVNIIGSLRLIDTACNHGVSRFVYISTGGAVYGTPERIPALEDDHVRPECHYGISKHTPEHYLELYRKLYALDYVVLRYPNVYGPRQNPHGEAGVVAIFLGAMLAGKPVTIYGDGKPARDYVYVSDIARANVKALADGGGQIICLGSGKATEVVKIFDECARATGYDGEPINKPLRQGEIERICINSAKAKDLLGWESTVGICDGIRLTLDALTPSP